MHAMANSGNNISNISTLADFQAAFGVSRETLDKLNLYESLLQRWQRTINLVAPATLTATWLRHFADSAQLARFVPAKANLVVDLGSGAGFPGLVLAIMAEERGGPRRFVLIESDQRKSAFLREVVRATGAAVEILSIRIETPETHASVGLADVVTSRALAPLERLLALAQPYFGPDTLGVFPKGRGVDAEIETARRTWDFDVELEPSLTESAARIALVRRPRLR
jgi:16S rRNA (guanine527-N7)-methyltransferase